MSISPRNLWPEDVAVTDAVAPVAILKEQASLLGQQTRNLVEARVTQRHSSKFDFCYYFELVAPALENYIYRLFQILHNIEFYPVWIDFYEDSPIEVQSEDEFMLELERVFSSEKTKRIISSLISQSKA